MTISIDVYRLWYFCFSAALCGMLGYRQFFCSDWLNEILGWQRKDIGCWGLDHSPDESVVYQGAPPSPGEVTSRTKSISFRHLHPILCFGFTEYSYSGSRTMMLKATVHYSSKVPSMKRRQMKAGMWEGANMVGKLKGRCLGQHHI